MLLILLRLCLLLPWTVAAPLKEPNELTQDDGVERDRMHSHTSLNTKRLIVRSGDIDFSGSLASSKDYGEINIGSISSNVVSKEHQHKESESGSEVQGLEQREEQEVFSCSFNDEQLAVKVDRDGQLSLHNTSASFRWDNNIIPYFFTSTSEKDKELFRNVMDIIEKKTCFKFEETEYKDKHSLEIEAKGYSCENGCQGGVDTSLVSDVVKLTATTQVNDKKVCELKCGGFILHEFMHALGMGHTQKRKDRDNFIIINKENIKASGVVNQFKKCEDCRVYNNMPYDCDSIMHYPTHQGDKELFKPIDPNTCKLSAIPIINEGPKGSDWDWKLLNIIGNCPQCVTSPGYPKNYPDKSEVEQTLSVTDGQAIEITFDYFDVEVHGNCSYDYLKFVDENENAVGEKMCGQDLPQKFTIQTSTASALFVSDGSVNKKGYKFCYRPVDNSIKCVTSPRYPNRYPDNINPNEILSIEAGHKIEITFHHFDVEFEATCSYDYLQFMDAYGKIVGKKMCGQSLPEKLTISTSLASAEFSSDGSVTKTGYRFCYKPV